MELFRSKLLLISAVIALILIGLSYAMAMQLGLEYAYMSNAALIEFLPEECGVLQTSKGVTAEVEFKRDIAGKIVDKTQISLNAKGVYAGASTVFNISARNISNIPLSVDEYRLDIDKDDKSLRNSLRFSCKVKLYKGNDNYYNLLGSFKNIGLDELDDHLTSILKYRKIDVNEKIVLEFSQYVETNHRVYEGENGLSYKLIPVFVQYFPKKA